MEDFKNTQQVFIQVLRGEKFELTGHENLQEMFSLFQRHRLLSSTSSLRSMLPEKSQKRWTQIVQRRSLISLQLFTETKFILDHLYDEGIEAIPLKGAFLGYQLYQDPGQRHFNDIDILVQPVDIEKVKAVLEKHGYYQAYPADLHSRQFRVYRQFKKDIGFRNDNKHVFIELHYGFYVHKLLKKADASQLRNNTTNLEIQGSTYKVLDNETTLFYLVFHGCLHQYFRLFWLKDVYEWMTKMEIDYDATGNIFEKTGLIEMLRITLRLLQIYFHYQPPGAWEKFLAFNSKTTRLVRICNRKILGPENETPALKLARHYFLFSLKPGLSYKITVLWSILQRKRIRKFMGGH